MWGEVRVRDFIGSRGSDIHLLALRYGVHARPHQVEGAVMDLGNVITVVAQPPRHQVRWASEVIVVVDDRP